MYEFLPHAYNYWQAGTWPSTERSSCYIVNSGGTRISLGGGGGGGRDNSKDGISIESINDDFETTFTLKACSLNAIATCDLFSESNRPYGI